MLFTFLKLGSDKCSVNRMRVGIQQQGDNLGDFNSLGKRLRMK